MALPFAVSGFDCLLSNDKAVSQTIGFYPPVYGSGRSVAVNYVPIAFFKVVPFD